MRPVFLLFFLAACVGPKSPPDVEPDKMVHFTVGLIASEFVTERTGDPWKGCAAALGLGVLKELYDRPTTGFNTRDLLATGLGGCALTWTF